MMDSPIKGGNLDTEKRDYVEIRRENTVEMKNWSDVSTIQGMLGATRS